MDLLNKKIVDSPGLRVNTVRNHQRNNFNNPGVENRDEAIINYLNIPEKIKKSSPKNKMYWYKRTIYGD